MLSPYVQCVLQNHMVNLTRTTGQKLLFEGKFAEAIPAAMQSLRFAAEIYGLASVELVPSYLILGRASIGNMLSAVRRLQFHFFPC